MMKQEEITREKTLQLRCKNGRQRWSLSGKWHQDPRLTALEMEWKETGNANSGDRVYRSLVQQHGEGKMGLERGLSFYASLQAEDGHWPGDYGGPMFLLPGLIIASYITRVDLGEPKRLAMGRYIQNHQNKDGGWGLHIEGKSTMFGTVMNYVALRLLGYGPQEARLSEARTWMKEHGGATGTPSWGKFYLSLLGVYPWEGNLSVMPELWLLPKNWPIHPGHYWCHTRMVYLPMTYLYGHRVTYAGDTLTQAIAKELFGDQPSRNWKKHRFSLAEVDEYNPVKWFTKAVYHVLHLYEDYAVVKKWRKKALDFALEYVEAEDEHTHYINIGPVNQVLNSLVVWHAHGQESEAFKRHVERWDDYLWLAEDGMKMQGYNGSQLWDTAFAVHAYTEDSEGLQHKETLTKAYQYLEQNQIIEEVRDPERYFRHPSVGGWPFSNRDHGWPISDCTALGFSAVLRLHKSGVLDSSTQTKISTDRLHSAIDVMLSLQNRDGSWSTYEKMRAGTWLEHLNPTGIFGEIMVDFPHVECSSSCIQALADALEYGITYRQDEVKKAITQGIGYVMKSQDASGGWYGNWGVCFTYGTWFALEALAAYRRLFPKDDSIQPTIERGTKFLLQQVLSDGGWGESHVSCVEKKYVSLEKPQAVQTAWALLGLMAVGHVEHPKVEQGIATLHQLQEASGDWPQQAISGVFNHNCMITYTAYRNVFPLWALARYRQKKKEVSNSALQ